MGILNQTTGKVYTDEDIARMRDELSEKTGLDISTMSDKSVVANWLVHCEPLAGMN